MSDQEVGEEVGGEGKGAVVLRCSPSLSGGQRRWLRSQGHHLDPVVQVGSQGIHEGVLRQIDRALLDHELIKVKINGGTSEARAEAAQAVLAEVGGQTVQILGNILLVYRAHPEEPKLKLPAARRRP